MTTVVGIFGLVTLVGVVSLLFGGNAFQAGKAREPADDDELLSSLRFAGRFYLWIGFSLTALGVVGMAVTGIAWLLFG